MPPGALHKISFSRRLCSTAWKCAARWPWVSSLPGAFSQLETSRPVTTLRVARYPQQAGQLRRRHAPYRDLPRRSCLGQAPAGASPKTGETRSLRNISAESPRAGPVPINHALNRLRVYGLPARARSRRVGAGLPGKEPARARGVALNFRFPSEGSSFWSYLLPTLFLCCSKLIFGRNRS